MLLFKSGDRSSKYSNTHEMTLTTFFLFLLILPNLYNIAAIIIGYEEPVYSLNETSSTTICIIVINLPLEDPLTISATLLNGPATLITAGELVVSDSCIHCDRNFNRNRF